VAEPTTTPPGRRQALWLWALAAIVLPDTRDRGRKRPSFWVGRSKARRLLIVLNLMGGAPPKVAPGQKVQFVGQIVDSAGGDHGVTDDAGLQPLRRQGHYASVSAFDLKVS